MFFSTITLVLFLSVAVFSGGIFSRFVLGERRLWALLALAPIIGIGGYTFLLNVAGYFMPIRGAFLAVIVVMCACAIVILFACRTRMNPAVSGGEDISYREQHILIIVATCIMLASGVVAVHSLALDDSAHMLYASTIEAGNFPVMDPMSPDHRMSYHYASDLLSAALGTLAAIPLWLALDVQTTLFAVLTFLMAFLLAYEISGRFKPSLAAAVLLMYGGGLLWLHVIDGIGPLWHVYVLHEQVIAPWKFLVPMTIPSLGTEFVYAMNNHSFAIGFPIMLLSIYSLFRALYGVHARRVFIILSGLSFGFLALCLETNFVIMWMALFCIFIGGVVLKMLPSSIRSLVPLSDGASFVRTVFFVLVLGTAIALLQGGIVSISSHTVQTGTHFEIAKQFWILDFSTPHTYLLSPLFFTEFGLVLILFVPATWMFRRDRRMLFLALMALGAFLAPFVVRYYPDTWEMGRLFGLSTPLMGFFVGLYLGRYLEDDREQIGRHGTGLVVFALLLCISSGVLMQIAYMVFPIGQIGKLNQPFIAKPAPLTTAEQLVDDWVKSHTTLNDRFFPFDYDFIFRTGRFTPGEYFGWYIRPDEIRAYNDLTASCSPQGALKLKIDYMDVGPDFPIRGFEASSTCQTLLRPTLVFSAGGGDTVQKVYKISPLNKGR